MLIENRNLSVSLLLVIMLSVGLIVGVSWPLSLGQSSTLDEEEYQQLKLAYQQLVTENESLGRKLDAAKLALGAAPKNLSKQADQTVAVDSVVNMGSGENSSNATNSPVSVLPDMFSSSIAEKIQQNPALDLTRELANSFSNEDVDVVWASQQEDVVRDLFMDNPALENILPGSIECKSLRCRIQIPLMDLDDGNRTSVAIANAIGSTPNLSNLSIVSGFDYERAALEIYIPRSQDVDLLQ